jgi:hypothetical protein
VRCFAARELIMHDNGDGRHVWLHVFGVVEVSSLIDVVCASLSVLGP